MIPTSMSPENEDIRDETQTDIPDRKTIHVPLLWGIAQARKLSAPRSVENRYAAQLRRLTWLLIHSGQNRLPPIDSWSHFVGRAFDDMANGVIQKVGLSSQVSTFRNRSMGYFGDAIRKYSNGEISKEELLANVETIARDQTLKLTAAIVQEKAHSGQYVWWTCLDDRVRKGHALLHGSVQSWNAPPNTGREEGENHPGEAIMCRCVALPIEPVSSR